MRAPLSAVSFVTVPLLAVGLAAQRNQATIEIAKHEVVLDHGVPKVGKHSLEELQVGGQGWRLGMNEASTLRTTVPLVAGDRVIAPGAYRVALERPAKEEFVLLADGAGLGLGGRDTSVRFPGSLGSVAKPTKELQIDWVPAAKTDDGDTRQATLRVQFGANEWNGAVTLIGARAPGKAGAWQVETYTWPAELLQKRIDADQATPIASLFRKSGDKKVPERWNLMAGKTTAVLVPQMKAPTDSFGFGAVVPPDAAFVTRGSAAWAEGKPQVSVSGLELRNAKAAGKELELVFGVRDRHVTVKVPEPPAVKS